MTAVVPVSGRSWNRRVKGWPGWIAVLAAASVVLLIGTLRHTGPQTDDDRIDAIAQQLACPVCEGESVYESGAPAAAQIRAQIGGLVREGKYSDKEIADIIVSDYKDYSLQLVPKATGVDSLVWILPVFAGVCAVAGLAVAFRRWRRAADVVPSNDDRELVARALADDAAHAGDADDDGS